jgi:hypothetical protein
MLCIFWQAWTRIMAWCLAGSKSSFREARGSREGGFYRQIPGNGFQEAGTTRARIQNFDMVLHHK